MDFLSYFALVVLFLVVLILAYGIIAIHDIPYLIAKARNHPHQDAVHAGGWEVCLRSTPSGLFFGFGPWPVILNTDTLALPRAGSATKDNPEMPPKDGTQDQVSALQMKVVELETALEKAKSSKSE
jgi:hypothetical protein